jgi:hypothetical protein
LATASLASGKEDSFPLRYLGASDQGIGRQWVGECPGGGEGQTLPGDDVERLGWQTTDFTPGKTPEVDSHIRCGSTAGVRDAESARIAFDHEVGQLRRRRFAALL